MRWECGYCGYVHDDDDKPGTCPVCGAPGSKFSERFDDDDSLEGRPDGEKMDSFEKDLFADYEDE